MVFSSSTISSTKPTQSITNQSTVKGTRAFSPRMETLKAVQKKLAEGSPVSHETLVKLAHDFKNGVITKEEANEQFVSAVVDGSIKGKLSDKDRDAMAKDIAEFFVDDVDFMNKLQKNLRDLG